MLTDCIKFQDGIDTATQERVRAFLTETLPGVEHNDCHFLKQVLAQTNVVHVRSYLGGLNAPRKLEGEIFKLSPIHNGQEVTSHGFFFLQILSDGAQLHRLTPIAKRR